jgi:hypothetical protein
MEIERKEETRKAFNAFHPVLSRHLLDFPIKFCALEMRSPL